MAPHATQRLHSQLTALLALKEARTPGQRKLDTNLLLAAWQRRAPQLLADLPAYAPGIAVAPDGTVAVEITGNVTPAVEEAVVRAGGRVLERWPAFHSLLARMSLDRLEELAALPDVDQIAPCHGSLGHGQTTSEAVVAQRVDQARSRHGVQGAGMRIGVLADSVDHLATVQASGDLPPVTVLAPGQGLGEGTAMLEVIADVAPAASLYFAPCGPTQASFAASMRALVDAGCRILVEDRTYFDEGVFQESVASQAIVAATAAGCLVFSAAGNHGSALRHNGGAWEGDFVAATPAPAHGPRWHDFGGNSTRNPLLAAGPMLVLTWADPLGASANDYDLILYDATGAIWKASTELQSGAGNPMELLDTSDVGQADLAVAIVLTSGEPRYLHLNTMGGRLATATAGSIYGHSGCNSTISVAAVAAHSLAPLSPQPLTQPYSADGPRRVFFDANGQAYTPGNGLGSGGVVLAKPDLTAADGVATSTPGFLSFSGTSAAAAHAAAIAALVWSANPQWPSQRVRAALGQGCLDIMAPGWDPASGHGVVLADGALRQALRPSLTAALLLLP